MSPESSRVRFAPLRTSRPARDIKSGRGIALRKRPAICERTARRRRKSVGVLVGPNPPIAGCLLFWLVVPKADRPKATPLRMSWATSQGNEAVIRSERMTAPASYLGPFSQKQSILDIHTEIPDGVLDLGVPEQDLDGAQVARCLVDHGDLGPSQRMRAIFR